MLVNKGFKFRAYPDDAQRPTLAQWFGCTRLVGNLGIDQRRMFSRRGRSISSKTQMADLPDLRAEYPWLKDCPAQLLQQALNDLDKAYQRFFEGKGGYPKKKSKYDRDSFRFPAIEQRQVVRKDGEAVLNDNGEPIWQTYRLITLHSEWIELPKIGKIRWVMHRPLQGAPKNVTVTREGGLYFISVCCEVEIDPAETPAPAVDAIAYDYGINKNYAMSDGTVVNIPSETAGEARHRLSLERHIGRCEETRKQREAERRAAGKLGAQQRLPQSRNELRARAALRGLDARLKRRAHDALHKFTTQTVRHAAVIGFEALKLTNMTASATGTLEEPGKNVAQKSGLNRGLLHGRPGMARLQVQYKADWMGRRAIAVSPPFTSQYCSKCQRHPKDNPSTSHIPHGRDGERFKCPLCGFKCDADCNAARNIEREARRIAALPPPPTKPKRKIAATRARGMRPIRGKRPNKLDRAKLDRANLNQDRIAFSTVGGPPMAAWGALATEQAANHEVSLAVPLAALREKPGRSRPGDVTLRRYRQ